MICAEFGREMKTQTAAIASVGFAMLFSSCATYELPPGYSGATASIRSTGKNVSSVKGEAYYIIAVNGKSAMHSPMATPYGGGMFLSLRERTLQVPCEPLDLKLSGGNIYAADGVAMADSIAGGNQSVTGNVKFTPKANGDYSVTGITGKGQTAVWIVDNKTGKIASGKVE